MFYKLKVRFYKNRSLKKIYYRLRGMLRYKPELPNDIRRELISRYAKNKSFADIGCMWGVNGYFAFLAEELGAKHVTGFDIYPPSEEFKKTKQARNSKVEFVQGDINSASSIAKLGKFDIVYCTGLLYHVPDPLLTLYNLRQICGETLILGTAVIPENQSIKNSAVYYPFLTSSQRKIWDLGTEDSQLGITEPFDPKQGYGNWIWGLTPSCVKSMLRTVGLKVRENYIGKFYSYFVCSLSSEPFLAVSGDWTEPKSESYKAYKYLI